MHSRCRPKAETKRESAPPRLHVRDGAERDRRLQKSVTAVFASLANHRSSVAGGAPEYTKSGQRQPEGPVTSVHPFLPAVCFPVPNRTVDVLGPVPEDPHTKDLDVHFQPVQRYKLSMVCNKNSIEFLADLKQFDFTHTSAFEFCNQGFGVGGGVQSFH